MSHRSVIDLMHQFNKQLNFVEKDIFGNQSPFDFDVSVKDIYNSLSVGATVVVIPRVNFMFPTKLVDFLNDYEITIGIWAVSVLRIIENLKGLEKSTPQTMRKIMFSGEVMSNKVLNYWRAKLPCTTFVNLYGPTEITCNCSYYTVEGIYQDDQPLPIGRPFQNTRMFLLDDDNQLVTSENAWGEICVAGSSLSLGHYNNEPVTNEVFVQNPLINTYEEKIYRTGDIGYYGPNKVLMFSSRKDNQIKHMGHRIELGEIEKIEN